MIGLCPFHNEKTPSFTVSPTKNFYKCFGCGESGNSVSFLMAHEHFSFPESIRYLANKYGIQLEETAVTPEVLAAQQAEESLFLVNDFARQFFQNQLFTTGTGKSVGLQYFLNRGFTEDTIRKFDLGFAPNQKDALTKAALQKGYTKETLEKLKLTNQYGGDFFKDRVMFTICNASGKVIAFAGRTLHKDKKIPKYINSPETEIYHKSKILYGMHLAKRAIRKHDRCLIVEGYTDVISMHQGGIEHVVASSGTSLTVGQIQLIKRFTNQVTILFDGDAAGTKAALRGLDLVLDQGMDVKVAQLPSGEDPDSYMQNKGKDAFNDFLEKNAKDFIFFKTDLLLADTAGDPVQKSAVIRSIVESIARIPDPLKRALYIRECAKIVELEEQMLVHEINQVVRKNIKKDVQAKVISNRQPRPINNTPPPSSPSNMPDLLPPNLAKGDQTQHSGDTFQERDIVRILVSGGDQLYDEQAGLTVAEFILTNIKDVMDDFEQPAFRKIVRACQSIQKRKLKSWSTFFTTHEDEQISKTAIDLMSEPYEYSENWEKRWSIFLQTQKMPDENFFQDSQQALLRFRLKKILRKCRENQALIEQYTKSQQMDKVVLHLKVQQRLIEMRNDIADQLGTVVF